MAEAGGRGAIDRRIRAWERELERIRLWLASAPEPVHQEHQARFVELYRAKEVAKSRWEALRGIYRPAPEAVRCLEESLAAMESAWQEAASLRTGPPPR